MRKTAPEAFLIGKKMGRRRGPVDYEGTFLYKGIGRSVFFDAKQTAEKYRLPLNRDHVPDHQKQFLVDRAEFGAVTFLYVVSTFHEEDHYYLVPVLPGQGDFLFERKSVPFTDMVEIGTPGDWLHWLHAHAWMWNGKDGMEESRLAAVG